MSRIRPPTAEVCVVRDEESPSQFCYVVQADGNEVGRFIAFEYGPEESVWLEVAPSDKGRVIRLGVERPTGGQKIVVIPMVTDVRAMAKRA